MRARVSIAFLLCLAGCGGGNSAQPNDAALMDANGTPDAATPDMQGADDGTGARPALSDPR